MRSIIAVSIRIGLSFIAAGAMTGVVWAGLLALTWMAGADWISLLSTPAHFVRYELKESQEEPSSLISLEDSIESLDLEVSSDDTSGSLVLVVRGATDSAPVTQRINSHGYSVRSATTGYDMWMLADNAIRSTGSFALLMISQFVGFGFVGWIQWRKLKGNHAIPFNRAVLFGLGLGGALAAIGTLVEIAAKALGRPITEQTWVGGSLNAGGAATVLFIVLIVIVGPIAEELFFRGLLFQLLRDRLTLIAAYVISSILFAGAHFNPSAVVLYLLYGAAFAFALQRTGRLITAVIAHSFVNAVAVVIVLN